MAKKSLYLLFFSIILLSFYFFNKYNENSKVEKHFKINSLIKSKDFNQSLEQAIKSFNLDRTNCSSIELNSINLLDSSGEYIIGQTNFDQIVHLDPSKDAFLNSYYLITTLIHEFEHCNQNQQIYTYVIEQYKPLEYLKNNFELLKELAFFTDLAAKSLQNDSKAYVQFEKLVKEKNLSISAEEILNLESELSKILSKYSFLMIELLEMKSILHTINHPQFKALYINNKSEIFQFQYRYLKLAFDRLLERSKEIPELADAKQCSFKKFLTGQLSEKYTETCKDSLKIINDIEI